MIRQIRLERMMRGLKLYELADMLEYHPVYWSEVERGRKEPPSEVAKKAAQLFGKSEEELFQPVGK